MFAGVRSGASRFCGIFPASSMASHIRRPQASRRAIRRAEFELNAPVNVTLDGESMKLQCCGVEILPAALDIVA